MNTLFGRLVHKLSFYALLQDLAKNARLDKSGEGMGLCISKGYQAATAGFRTTLEVAEGRKGPLRV